MRKTLTPQQAQRILDAVKRRAVNWSTTEYVVRGKG